MRYILEPGMQVKLKSYSECDFSQVACMPGMEELFGSIVTILSAGDRVWLPIKVFRVVENQWSWDENWIERVVSSIPSKEPVVLNDMF